MQPDSTSMTTDEIAAPPSVSSDPLATTIESLRNRIQEAGHTPELPWLAPRDLEEPELNALQKMLKKALDWLMGHFSPVENSGEDIVLIIKILGVLLLAVIVGLVLYGIYKLIRQSQGKLQRTTKAPRQLAVDSRPVLEALYSEALAQRNYAKAARIRWRLFLLRTQRPSGQTPTDVLTDTRRDHRLQDISTDQTYALMFAALPNNKEHQKEWSEKLNSAENTESGSIQDSALLLMAAVGMILLLLWSLFSEQQSIQERAVTRGQGPFQVSPILQLRPEGMDTRLSLPILEPEVINTKDGAAVFLLMSPRVSLSRREAQILSDKIKDGVHLITSFHDQTSREAVEESLRFIEGVSLGPIIANPKFQNRVVQKVEAATEFEWFKKGESYAFYSPFIMKDMKCDFEYFFCFAREFYSGKGYVTVIAGLFPGAAGLALEADNSRMAARLIQYPGPLIIDEYHLLQSDRSIMDLLAEPFFLVPLLILVMGLIGFMIWGTETAPSRGYAVLRSDRPHYLKRRPHQAESYHQFSRRLLFQALKRPQGPADAEKIQAELLTQLISARQGKAPDVTHLNPVQLTQKHIHWLKQNSMWKDRH